MRWGDWDKKNLGDFVFLAVVPWHHGLLLLLLLQWQQHQHWNETFQGDFVDFVDFVSSLFCFAAEAQRSCWRLLQKWQSQQKCQQWIAVGWLLALAFWSAVPPAAIALSSCFQHELHWQQHRCCDWRDWWRFAPTGRGVTGPTGWAPRVAHLRSSL